MAKTAKARYLYKRAVDSAEVVKIMQSLLGKIVEDYEKPIGSGDADGANADGEEDDSTKTAFLDFISDYDFNSLLGSLEIEENKKSEIALSLVINHLTITGYSTEGLSTYLKAWQESLAEIKDYMTDESGDKLLGDSLLIEGSDNFRKFIKSNNMVYDFVTGNADLFQMSVSSNILANKTAESYETELGMRFVDVSDYLFGGYNTAYQMETNRLAVYERYKDSHPGLVLERLAIKKLLVEEFLTDYGMITVKEEAEDEASVWEWHGVESLYDKYNSLENKPSLESWLTTFKEALSEHTASLAAPLRESINESTELAVSYALVMGIKGNLASEQEVKTEELESLVENLKKIQSLGNSLSTASNNYDDYSEQLAMVANLYIVANDIEYNELTLVVGSLKKLVVDFVSTNIAKTVFSELTDEEQTNPKIEEIFEGISTKLAHFIEANNLEELKLDDEITLSVKDILSRALIIDMAKSGNYYGGNFGTLVESDIKTILQEIEWNNLLGQAVGSYSLRTANELKLLQEMAEHNKTLEVDSFKEEEMLAYLKEKYADGDSVKYELLNNYSTNLANFASYAEGDEFYSDITPPAGVTVIDEVWAKKIFEDTAKELEENTESDNADSPNTAQGTDTSTGGGVDQTATEQEKTEAAKQEEFYEAIAKAYKKALTEANANTESELAGVSTAYSLSKLESLNIDSLKLGEYELVKESLLNRLYDLLINEDSVLAAEVLSYKNRGTQPVHLWLNERLDNATANVNLFNIESKEAREYAMRLMLLKQALSLNDNSEEDEAAEDEATEELVNSFTDFMTTQFGITEINDFFIAKSQYESIFLKKTKEESEKLILQYVGIPIEEPTTEEPTTEEPTTEEPTTEEPTTEEPTTEEPTTEEPTTETETTEDKTLDPEYPIFSKEVLFADDGGFLASTAAAVILRQFIAEGSSAAEARALIDWIIKLSGQEIGLVSEDVAENLKEGDIIDLIIAASMVSESGNQYYAGRIAVMGDDRWSELTDSKEIEALCTQAKEKEGYIAYLDENEKSYIEGLYKEEGFEKRLEALSKIKQNYSSHSIDQYATYSGLEYIVRKNATNSNILTDAIGFIYSDNLDVLNKATASMQTKTTLKTIQETKKEIEERKNGHEHNYRAYINKDYFTNEDEEITLKEIESYSDLSETPDLNEIFIKNEILELMGEYKKSNQRVDIGFETYGSPTEEESPLSIEYYSHYEDLLKQDEDFSIDEAADLESYTGIITDYKAKTGIWQNLQKQLISLKETIAKLGFDIYTIKKLSDEQLKAAAEAEETKLNTAKATATEKLAEWQTSIDSFTNKQAEFNTVFEALDEAEEEYNKKKKEFEKAEAIYEYASTAYLKDGFEDGDLNDGEKAVDYLPVDPEERLAFTLKKQTSATAASDALKNLYEEIIEETETEETTNEDFAERDEAYKAAYKKYRSHFTKTIYWEKMINFSAEKIAAQKEKIKEIEAEIDQNLSENLVSHSSYSLEKLEFEDDVTTDGKLKAYDKSFTYQDYYKLVNNNGKLELVLQDKLTGKIVSEKIGTEEVEYLDKRIVHDEDGSISEVPEYEFFTAIKTVSLYVHEYRKIEKDSNENWVFVNNDERNKYFYLGGSIGDLVDNYGFTKEVATNAYKEYLLFAGLSEEIVESAGKEENTEESENELTDIDISNMTNREFHLYTTKLESIAKDTEDFDKSRERFAKELYDTLNGKNAAKILKEWAMAIWYADYKNADENYDQEKDPEKTGIEGLKTSFWSSQYNSLNPDSILGCMVAKIKQQTLSKYKDGQYVDDMIAKGKKSYNTWKNNSAFQYMRKAKHICFMKSEGDSFLESQHKVELYDFVIDAVNDKFKKFVYIGLGFMAGYYASMIAAGAFSWLPAVAAGFYIAAASCFVTAMANFVTAGEAGDVKNELNKRKRGANNNNGIMTSITNIEAAAKKNNELSIKLAEEKEFLRKLEGRPKDGGPITFDTMESAILTAIADGDPDADKNYLKDFLGITDSTAAAILAETGKESLDDDAIFEYLQNGYSVQIEEDSKLIDIMSNFRDNAKEGITESETSLNQRVEKLQSTQKQLEEDYDAALKELEEYIEGLEINEDGKLDQDSEKYKELKEKLETAGRAAFKNSAYVARSHQRRMTETKLSLSSTINIAEQPALTEIYHKQLMDIKNNYLEMFSQRMNTMWELKTANWQQSRDNFNYKKEVWNATVAAIYRRGAKEWGIAKNKIGTAQKQWLAKIEKTYQEKGEKWEESYSTFLQKKSSWVQEISYMTSMASAEKIYPASITESAAAEIEEATKNAVTKWSNENADAELITSILTNGMFEKMLESAKSSSRIITNTNESVHGYSAIMDDGAIQELIKNFAGRDKEELEKQLLIITALKAMDTIEDGKINLIDTAILGKKNFSEKLE